MLRRHRGPKWLGGLAIALCACLALAACGGGSGSGSSGESAQTLLTQTFGGKHQIKSGVLNFSVTINTNGSSTLTSPITFSISGPFQSRGAGKVPASHLTISIGALGQSYSLGVITTGNAAYLTLGGVAYQLPAASFQKLEQSFSSSATKGGATERSALSKLGIHPLAWLENARVVGTASVGGTSTTHIHANVNVDALVTQLANAITKTASSTSSTASLASKITPAEIQKVASAVKNASVDVWTAQGDHTLRRVSINLTVSVSGKTSTTLGGVTSAGLNITLQYTSLNEPQTITAPANVQPFSGFQAKLQSLLGGLGAGSLLGSGSSGSSVGSSATTTPANVKKYAACLKAAGGNIVKAQKCSTLLGTG